MTTPPAPSPPRPPLGSGIRYKDGRVAIGSLWKKWSAPLADVAVQTSGAPGKRVTVILSTPQGETRQLRVNPQASERTLAWALAFNAWRQAQAG